MKSIVYLNIENTGFHTVVTSNCLQDHKETCQIVTGYEHPYLIGIPEKFLLVSGANLVLPLLNYGAKNDVYYSYDLEGDGCQAYIIDIKDNLLFLHEIENGVGLTYQIYHKYVKGEYGSDSINYSNSNR